MDKNLDRLGEYSIWHKPSLNADFQPFVDIKMKSSSQRLEAKFIDAIVRDFNTNN